MIRLVMVLMVLGATAAHADDNCVEHLRTFHVKIAVYWDGKALQPVHGARTDAGDVVFYFAKKTPPTKVQLQVPVEVDPKSFTKEPDAGPCGELSVWTWKRSPEQAGAVRSSLADAVNNYRGGVGVRSSVRTFTADSATDVAAEAAQILGQIIVDRASNAAYALVGKKAKSWLHCAGQTNFPATCGVLSALRLQDLAMAPDQLRGSITSDILALVRLPQMGEPNATDIMTTLDHALSSEIVPVLGRPVSTLTSHPSEALVRRFVDKAMNHLVSKGEDAIDAAIGSLGAREHILALVGAGVAMCEAQRATANECEIMTEVDKLEHDHGTAKPLDDTQLAFAESTAGYFWDALTLKTGNTADNQKRLVAALEGTFAVACMYASAESGPYECQVSPTATGTPSATETVGLARDIAIAATNRDGAAIGRLVIAALQRVLPPADCTDCAKGVRVLSTVAAYAATYVGSSSSSDDAHKQRTSLLQSLTADMTQRTERGGDTIVSFGGALRGVGGVRFSRPYTKDDRVDKAWAAPLSLPIGFAIDWLNDADDTRGWHLELGIVDFGQYLSWNQGGELSTPDLTSAISPTLTVARTWTREVPFFIGVTGGYTPSFDFESGVAGAKKGAFNVGLTVGAYVPLFDFN